MTDKSDTKMSKPTPEALQLVKSLMAQPENAICADCKKKAAKWASSTLGVFICIDCSGIHRSLGTHITFVRSCTLDSWTPEQARVMKRVGNKVGNEYWEARIPPDFMRPNPHDRAGMEYFIRMKYAERRFAGPGEPPHLRTGATRTQGSGVGGRPIAGMYDGYFAHNPVQQKPAQQFFMGKQMSPSRSTEQLKAAPAKQGASQMNLNDFMSKLAKPAEDSTTDQSDSTPGSVDNTSSFDFMKGDEAEESPSPSPIATPPPPVATPPPPEPKPKPAPAPKPVAKKPATPPKTDFPMTGSTAHDIMMMGDTGSSGSGKKQSLFQKKKGASRFAKKPGAKPAGDGNVIGQMLDMSDQFRPVSAPVRQASPASSQLGFFGQQQQQPAPVANPYEQQQQQYTREQYEADFRQQYGPLAFPDPDYAQQQQQYYPYH